ncbi:hypothetical protein [Pseudonocardia sp.]|uniref:hypothetical protein n=1 Tax=Pseudonocardia sp. TaxID=60912 RepID=UPI003D0CBF92
MTAPTAAPTAPLTSTVDRFLDAVAAGAVTADLYADDVVLDAVVPDWRFAVAGPAAVAAEYARWFADPARIEELRRLRTATGEVVEYTLCWTEQGVPHAARHVHVLDLGADGRIVADHVWCGGRWPAALLAEMEGERASTERQRGRSGTSPESSIDTEMEAARDAH